MAPTLTATPDPVAHVVNLVVNAATGAITVTRFTPGQSPPGTPVRGSFANGRTVPDYDAPLNTDLIYIATDTAGQSAQIPARLASALGVLSLMSSPALNMAVEVLSDDSQAYTGASTARKILGSNAPLVTVEPIAYRSGTYRLHLPTVGDWLALRAILMPGGVMLLRSPCQSEYLDTAFILTAGRQTIAWASAPPRHRVFELDYQATAPDSTPPQDYAWTYGDIPTKFATYGDIPLTVATYADLATLIP